VPLYEYQCGECSHTFERRQHFNEEPVSVCPQCGGRCRRLIRATAFIVKGGSGFSGSSSRSTGDDGPGESYTSGEDFFERSGVSSEKTTKIRKAQAILRGDSKEAGVG
jgi:putative FmdB family regulatory protein